MSRTGQPRIAAIGLPDRIDAARDEARAATDLVPRRRIELASHWAFYIGRGDQFDDDRRLVRTAELAG